MIRLLLVIFGLIGYTWAITTGNPTTQFGNSVPTPLWVNELYLRRMRPTNYPRYHYNLRGWADWPRTSDRPLYGRWSGYTCLLQNPIINLSKLPVHLLS
ncbi:hypothetical protein Ciccas_004890 [Cichlidogyrus casuarinus]|uniref:Uncharacterized protein n=1 Tax=Cichlidogyrus casuarinus TaxID=1844966 RepID=A0ABD2QCJ2_9PLAT